ncbi:hypothetical protein GCM10027059_37310 [Myceligenerans halotolerans]
MVSSQPTRKVLKELRDAGFTPGRTVGSHTQWKHPSGVSVSVPDGHRQISPGVYRKVLKAIKDSKEGTK